MFRNSRPLSDVTSKDVEEPSTPSHLLNGRRLLSLPEVSNGDLSDPDFELSLTDLTKRMRHLSDVTNHLWRRWRDECLVELRDSHRRSSVGDVVVVHGDQPRGMWRLGRVERLTEGTDSLVRGATWTGLSCTT